jgi:hypothetical protein
MRRSPLIIALVSIVGCPAPDLDVEDVPGTTDVPAPTTSGTDPSVPGTSASDDTTSTGDVDTTTGGGGGTTTSTSTTTTSTTDPGTTTAPGTTDPMTTDPGGTSTGGGETDGEGNGWQPKPCPGIYSQNLLPTFELTIAPGELAELQAEWLLADDNNLDEHPLELFKYGEIEIDYATVRLRGNSSHWAGQGKMQLEVAFNKVDKEGRFLGLKKVLFDAAEFNRSFLRDRLALQIMRDVGLPAPCANNARVMLNGSYYGLFTNIEKVDSEFLERYFEEPNGNLYKRSGGTLGYEKKTNEEDKDKSDAQALKAADTVDELDAVMNLDEALLEWATEAVIPDRDGAWAGGLNFYMYNDPKTGFNVIPWDLDDSFTRLTPDIDPVTWMKPPEVFHGRPYYDLALSDPALFQQYIDTLDHVVSTGYQVDVLQARIDAWAEQIKDAAEDDPNRPFTYDQHRAQVKKKRQFVADRAAFLKGWLECWKNGGTDENGDGVCDPG